MLSYSIEENIEPKLKFYESRGYSRDYIIKQCWLFNYSWEKRIKPRFAFLDYLGIKESNLVKILYPNDENFSIDLTGEKKAYIVYKAIYETEIMPKLAYLDYLDEKYPENLDDLSKISNEDFSKTYFKDGKKDYLEFLKKYKPYKNYKKKENRERD